ncbi:hypothetical protein [Nitrosospira sp. Nsp1]|uniref:hypothetical protein n=1 Tax=Nitrosospira sp. Nsp1 TaxID=136547 RepID=UPI00088938B0|nr:hypothetical protein [Nitrosospira sp. Nsp1]SCX62755.1 hypothetical protein SAMN05720354_13231 [Nitrosospira sp. Nsp1]
MKTIQRCALLALTPLLLIGCGNFNSIHRGLEVSNGKGALIDIKQRAIISSVITTKDEEGNLISQTRVCAEPSPDALSAYAAELIAKADSGKLGGELAAAFQEGSSFVGLRTQSIQLMRDAYYRLCESYVSGAVNSDEYGWLLRRFQRSMVVLLAIEQLTGTVRPPTISITTQGQAEAAKSLSEIRNEKQKIDAQIKVIEGSEQTEATIDELNTLKKDSKLMEKAISNARNLLASGSTAISNTTDQPNPPNETQVSAVAAIVKDMVASITSEADDRGALCFFYLRSQSKKEGNPELNKICEAYFADGFVIDAVPNKNAAKKIPDDPPFLIGNKRKQK